MPTNQPSSAPDQVTPQPSDRDTAASVLHDDTLDQTAGGGGLAGSTGAQSATGGGQGGTTPNAPIDTGLAGASPEAEALRQARDDAPETDHPSSQ